MKLESVPKYRTTLAQELAEGCKHREEILEGRKIKEETEDEEHVDLYTPFVDTDTLQQSWVDLSDDAAILETEEGEERDAANTKSLFVQGLHVLRASKVEEQQALQDQAFALQQQALGVKRQQRAIHMELCAIQRMELALAFTPAMETANMLRQSLMSAQELGLRQVFAPNPDVAAAAQDLAAVHVQRAARLPQGTHATGKGLFSLAIPAPFVINRQGHPEEKRPVLMYREAPKDQKGKKGEKSRYYDCPWESCPNTMGSRDGMNAHIRFHTDQVLLCPNGDRCPEAVKSKYPFAHRNADSLRAHYKKDVAEGIQAGKADEVLAVRQIMTPDWFLARQIYKTS